MEFRTIGWGTSLSNFIVILPASTCTISRGPSGLHRRVFLCFCCQCKKSIREPPPSRAHSSLFIGQKLTEPLGEVKTLNALFLFGTELQKKSPRSRGNRLIIPRAPLYQSIRTRCIKFNSILASAFGFRHRSSGCETHSGWEFVSSRAVVSTAVVPPYFHLCQEERQHLGRQVERARASHSPPVCMQVDGQDFHVREGEG